MRRGEIWSAATGSGFGGKPRPVVILQSDAFVQTPNVIVALFESARGEPDEVRPRIVPDPTNRLEHTSDVAVDLIVTVPARKFGRPIGRLSADDMRRVDTALSVILGFA